MNKFLFVTYIIAQNTNILLKQSIDFWICITVCLKLDYIIWQHIDRYSSTIDSIQNSSAESSELCTTVHMCRHSSVL
jgi:hypothetical protein